MPPPLFKEVVRDLYFVARVAVVEEETVDLPQHGVGHGSVHPGGAVDVQKSVERRT